jgi:DNA-binding MarR family transcriptional regulator
VTVELDDMAVADRIGQQLMRLLRMVAKMRHQGGDVAVAHVLMALLERGPQRVGEIAQSLGTDPSTVSRQVTALVDAGLVERRAHPVDGRAHLLAATESGTHRCVDGRRRRIDVVAAVLADWSTEDRHRLAALLGRFADDMHANNMPDGDGRIARRPGGEN